MINDVDETLRALLRRDALRTNDIEIAFDAPTKEWASRRNTPTIDVYLYDIRENLDRRQTMFDELRDDEGRLHTRKPAPRWFNLSYLVTAWTQRPEDEHRLLSSVLLCFLRINAIPHDVLAGALASLSSRIVVNIGRPPSQDRAISDIWSALGGELKPSLDLVLTVPFEPAVDIPMGPPVLEAPSVRVIGPDGEVEIPAAARTPAVRDLLDESGATAPRVPGGRRAQYGPVGFQAWAATGRRVTLEEAARQAEAAGGGPGDGQAAAGTAAAGEAGSDAAATGKAARGKAGSGRAAPGKAGSAKAGSGDGALPEGPGIDEDADGDAPKIVTEEAAGGTERMPGRRMRFHLIEPPDRG